MHPPTPPLTNKKLDTGAVSPQTGDRESRGYVPQSSWPGSSPEVGGPTSQAGLVSSPGPGVLHTTLPMGGGGELSQ